MSRSAPPGVDLFAHQPAVGVVHRRRLVEAQRGVGRQVGAQQVAVGVAQADRGNVREVDAVPAQAERRVAAERMVRDDDGDRAVRLGIRHLRRERTGAAVDERDLAGDGRCVDERRLAAIHHRQVAAAGRRPRVTDAVVHQHHVAGDAGAGQRRAEVGAADRIVARDAGRGVDAQHRRRRDECGARAVGARAAGSIEAAAVQLVDGLTPHIGIRLVEGARLPLIDEAVRELGVGVRPLVAGDVVGGEAWAERDEDAVPGSVRALVAAVEDRVHGRAVAVERVAAEGVLEVVVGLFRRLDHVVGFDGARWEGVALHPERRIGVARRHVRQVGAVVGAAVQVVGDATDLVDVLAGVRVHVHELTNCSLAVSDLDFPRKVVLAGDALHQALAEDHEAVAAGGSILRCLVGCDLADRDLRDRLEAARRRGADAEVGHEHAVHRAQLAADGVGTHFGAEHRQAVVDLAVDEMAAAVLVVEGAHQRQLGRGVADAECGTVRLEEIGRSLFSRGLQCGWRGLGGGRCRGEPHEPSAAGGAVQADARGAALQGGDGGVCGAVRGGRSLRSGDGDGCGRGDCEPRKIRVSGFHCFTSPGRSFSGLKELRRKGRRKAIE